MGVYKSSVKINAPKELVFQTISEANNFSRAIPEIKEVDFLTEIHMGVGTRFKETRLMKGRKTSTVLEVTEYENNNHIRLVSEAGGTTWDTLFSVSGKNNNIELTLEMEARPHTLIARIMNAMIKGMLQKALDRDMKSVKEFCEKERDQVKT